MDRTPEREQLVKLVQILARRFQEGYLRALCGDLGINYDDLLGKEIADKAEELVTHSEVHRPISELELVVTRGLLDWIGRDHKLYPAVLAVQQQLSENVKQSQRHGDTSTLSAERWRMINELNKLTLIVRGVSLEELCDQIETTEHIEDPLSMVELRSDGPVWRILRDVKEAQAHSNWNEALRLCEAAMNCARDYYDQVAVATAQLYMANALAQSGHLQEGIVSAGRARQNFQLMADHRNQVLAELLIGCLRLKAEQDELDVYEYYRTVFYHCRDLESKAKWDGRAKEEQFYAQLISELQQVLTVLETTVKERLIGPDDAGYPVVKRRRRWDPGRSSTGTSSGRPTNPYIAGHPIRGTEMFFGRQDVFRFVRETLVGRYQDNAIVLYGGRRTGKTSVLYQMNRHLDPRYAPVFVDLQGISLAGLGEMLWGIAHQAVRVLYEQKEIRVNIPPRDDFADDPEGCFREGFLDPALQALGDDHLLLMLDEAARLYEQVRDDRLESRVFDLLRSLIQHHPRLNFIFSIGSGLEEMRQEYALLFNVCQYKKISFLDRDAAEALITEPVEEHYLYTPQAVERILEVTHGQPYYTQLVCNRLFARWARQDRDEVTVSDVEAVLGEAVEQGMASLQYTWEEVSDAAKVVLAALAERMVIGNQPVGRNDLQATIVAQDIPLSRRAVSGALRELVTREALRPDDGSYVFTVDLMRLWVQQYQRLEWVKNKFPSPEEARPTPGRDWVRMVLVGASAGLVFLLIGLGLVVTRSAEQSRISRQATVTALSGTISALETAIAGGAGGAVEPQKTLQAQLAVFQTQSAEEQATRQVPTSTPHPTDTPLPTETPSPTAMPTSTSMPTPTSTPTPAGASVGVTRTRSVDGMPMVYVRAGDFEMGSDSDAVDYALQLCNEYLGDCKQEWFGDEQPAHTVALDGFWIDQTEVTNAQYRRCVEAGTCDPPVESSSTTRDSYYSDSTYDGYPVIWVTWHQAAAYCEWAGARLPTEAEWEYAARGSDRRMYPWGNAAPDCAKANYLGKDGGCVGDTTAVGSYPAGASWCNTLDMAGNVWEWVADWYEIGYYGRSPSRNPMGPSSGEYRVLRGGSRYDAAYIVRSAHRYGYLPDNANNDVGFRCARGSE